MKCSLLAFAWHANFHTNLLLPLYQQDLEMAKAWTSWGGNCSQNGFQTAQTNQLSETIFLEVANIYTGLIMIFLSAVISNH